MYKRYFNLSRKSKVSAQTFTRGCKRHIQLGQTLRKFIDFMIRKYFTLILKMKLIKIILIICTSIFCDRHGDFQNMKAYI